MTGTGDLIIRCMIERIDTSRPPGVFNSMRTASACAAAASSSARPTNSSVIGWIMSSIRIRTMAADAEPATSRTSRTARRLTAPFSLRSGLLVDAGADGVEQRRDLERLTNDGVKRKVSNFQDFIKRSGDHDDLLEKCGIGPLDAPDEVDAAVGHLQIQEDRVVLVTAEHAIRLQRVERRMDDVRVAGEDVGDETDDHFVVFDNQDLLRLSVQPRYLCLLKGLPGAVANEL